MEKLIGSRHLALLECQKAAPGTVGAIIARILTMPGIWLTVKYEVASGDIGPFYARPETRAILQSPWSDANLRELAMRETQFYRTQGGSAGFLGQLVPEEGRYQALKLARNTLF